MLRRAPALLLVLGFLALLSHSPPAAASSKIVALVIGNELPDSNAGLANKLGDLKRQLFGYGNDQINQSTIIDGLNLSKDELLARLSAFESGLSDAEVAFFYYVGLAAHSPEGHSYLVPAGWDGSNAAGLVGIRGVLDRMRASGKGLVFLDAMKPGAGVNWSAPNIRPGLGKFASEAHPTRLEIALVDVMAGPGSAQGLLADALARQLKLERIRLPQLASLVQEDVGFETGRIHVPRIFGSVNGASELKRLTAGEIAEKTQKCLAERERRTASLPQASAEPAMVGSASTPGDFSEQGKGTEQAGRQREFWRWFCPELEPSRSVPAPAGVARHSTPGSGPEGQRVGTTAGPSGQQRTGQTGVRANGGGNNRGGVAPHRAAASGVPIP